jgi:hypothetical protein
MNPTKWTVRAGTGMAGVMAGAAMAVAGPSTGTDADTDADHRRVAADACGFESFWGVHGVKSCDSDVLSADWDRNGTVDEEFVVAPNRTIWHTWQRAGKWIEMEHGGRADNTSGYSTPHGKRCVYVEVNQPHSFYRSCYFDSAWHRWVKSDHSP